MKITRISEAIDVVNYQDVIRVTVELPVNFIRDVLDADPKDSVEMTHEFGEQFMSEIGKYLHIVQL